MVEIQREPLPAQAVPEETYAHKSDSTDARLATAKTTGQGTTRRARKIVPQTQLSFLGLLGQAAD